MSCPYGSPIAFLPADQMDNFLQGYYAHYHKRLNLSAEEEAATIQRARTEGFIDPPAPKADFSSIEGTGYVFFNPNRGPQMGFQVNSAFPLAFNPYFEAEHSELHLRRLLASPSVSKELVHFCIEHCQADLPFFQEGQGKHVLDDLDFLLRFWKMESYHTLPMTAFTGKDYHPEKE